MPSSRQITLAVPNSPLYNFGWPTCLPLSIGIYPPWACSFVLMTSSGQVTMPDVKPPMAPAMALNCESEARAAHRRSRVSSTGWWCCIGGFVGASRRYADAA